MMNGPASCRVMDPGWDISDLDPPRLLHVQEVICGYVLSKIENISWAYNNTYVWSKDKKTESTKITGSVSGTREKKWSETMVNIGKGG